MIYIPFSTTCSAFPRAKISKNIPIQETIVSSFDTATSLAFSDTPDVWNIQTLLSIIFLVFIVCLSVEVVGQKWCVGKPTERKMDNVAARWIPYTIIRIKLSLYYVCIYHIPNLFIVVAFIRMKFLHSGLSIFLLVMKILCRNEY